jgi:hypothetical protein
VEAPVEKILPPSPKILDRQVLMDFEDSVVHDVDWLAAQPKGTVGVVLQQKTGNGPDKWELAIGKGRNGGNAVRVFSPDAAWGEPDVFIVKFRSTGGSVEQFRDEEGFLNEQGRRANRLSFWIKFDDEDWINEVAAIRIMRTCILEHTNSTVT